MAEVAAGGVSYALVFDVSAPPNRSSPKTATTEVRSGAAPALALFCQKQVLRAALTMSRFFSVRVSESGTR